MSRESMQRAQRAVQTARRELEDAERALDDQLNQQWNAIHDAPDGVVIQFKRNFGRWHEYTYVAIRAAGAWYITGSDGRVSTELLIEEHLDHSVAEGFNVVQLRGKTVLAQGK